MRLTLLLAALCGLLLSACDREEQPPPPKLFESQRNAMDKAKGVEDTLQRQADQQLQDIDRQTQDSSKQSEWVYPLLPSIVTVPARCWRKYAAACSSKSSPCPKHWNGTVWMKMPCMY